MMKSLFRNGRIVCLFIYLGLSNVAFAQGEKKIMLAPLDTVPMWVHEVLSAEECEMLQTISSIYMLDYSFLQDENFNKYRKAFFQSLTEVYEAVKSGKNDDKKASVLAFSRLITDVDRSILWKKKAFWQINTNTQLCMQSGIVYKNPVNNDIGIQLDVWYKYDADKKKVDVIYYKLSSLNPFSRINGIVVFNDMSEQNTLEGNLSVSFEYYVAERYMSERVHKGFCIPL